MCPPLRPPTLQQPRCASPTAEADHGGDEFSLIECVVAFPIERGQPDGFASPPVPCATPTRAEAPRCSCRLESGAALLALPGHRLALSVRVPVRGETFFRGDCTRRGLDLSAGGYPAGSARR
jgi:hypothetical protein